MTADHNAAARAEPDILDSLGNIWRCLRCDCNSCGRGGAGELHDHICTNEPGCVETRERLRARRTAEAVIAWRAKEEITRLRTDADRARQEGRREGMEEAAKVALDNECHLAHPGSPEAAALYDAGMIDAGSLIAAAIRALATGKE